MNCRWFGYSDITPTANQRHIELFPVCNSSYFYIAHPWPEEKGHKKAITCSPMIGHLFDTINMASTEKEWYRSIDSSKKKF